MVILDFGAPRPWIAAPTVFSQRIFGQLGTPLISLARVRQALEQFSRGYHDGWQTPRSGDISIVWGTSNGKIPSVWSAETAHLAGRRFSEAVKQYHDWVKTRVDDPDPSKAKTVYNKQAVMGGMDIEQDQREYSDFPITRSWYDGFVGLGPTRRPFLNFGSNEIGNCTSPCGHGSWTTSRLVGMSRGVEGRTFTCPQIYLDVQISNPVTGGWTFTQRWADLNGNGKPILFFCTLGTLSPPTYLDARVAWQHFWDAMANVDGTNYAAVYVQRRVTHIKFADRPSGL